MLNKNLFEQQNISLCVLGSGSRGNCTYLRVGEYHCLIDAGMSYTEIKHRLKTQGIDIAYISHIFITHEHTDHISALKTLTNRHRVNICCTSKTYLQIGGLLSEQTHIIFLDHPFSIDGITVLPFPVSHDAVDPMGYSFMYQDKKISITTDLGHVSSDVIRYLEDSDILIIESNHDENMLWNGPYAWPLKQRIAGESGHLSNRQTAEAIELVYHDQLKYILLAHLSQENNEPVIAFSTVDDYLKKTGNYHTELLITNQHVCSTMINL
jgi:phosphoribosyl 1,2-cyclic phosphodiesterase